MTDLQTGDVDLRIIIDDDENITKMTGPLATEAQHYVDVDGYTFDQLTSKLAPLWAVVGTDDSDLDPTIGNEPDEGEEVAKVNIAKADTDKRQVFGWAYVSQDADGTKRVDISGEHVVPEELEKAAYRYVLTSRSQGDLHQRIAKDSPLVVGTMIESVVVTPEKIEKWGLPPGSMHTGWWVGFQVNDDTVWEEIKAGRRRQFSIHGKGQKRAA